jgi:hypothetical protein
MKIKAIIEFDSYEREFIIPCGTGDKTFKWLAIAASQRFFYKLFFCQELF